VEMVWQCKPDCDLVPVFLFPAVLMYAMGIVGSIIVPILQLLLSSLGMGTWWGKGFVERGGLMNDFMVLCEAIKDEEIGREVHACLEAINLQRREV
jgi:hypothetical protein